MVIGARSISPWLKQSTAFVRTAPMPDRTVREAAVEAMTDAIDVGRRRIAERALDALASSAEVREVLVARVQTGLGRPFVKSSHSAHGYRKPTDDETEIAAKLAVAAVLDALGGTADTEDRTDG